MAQNRIHYTEYIREVEYLKKKKEPYKFVSKYFDVSLL